MRAFLSSGRTLGVTAALLLCALLSAWPASAREAAPRIVAHCLMPFKDRPLAWAARVRVAQALIPWMATIRRN